MTLILCLILNNTILEIYVRLLHEFNSGILIFTYKYRMIFMRCKVGKRSFVNECEEKF